MNVFEVLGQLLGGLFGGGGNTGAANFPGPAQSEYDYLKGTLSGGARGLFMPDDPTDYDMIYHGPEQGAYMGGGKWNQGGYYRTKGNKISAVPDPRLYSNHKALQQALGNSGGNVTYGTAGPVGSSTGSR